MKKSKLLLTCVIVFFAFAYEAQVKYEFMIIAYFPQAKDMTIAIDGKEVLHLDIDANRYEKVAGDALLKKVNEYQDQDWEVMTFANSNAGSMGNQEFYCYLKRRKTR